MVKTTVLGKDEAVPEMEVVGPSKGDLSKLAEGNPYERAPFAGSKGAGQVSRVHIEGIMDYYEYNPFDELVRYRNRLLFLAEKLETEGEILVGRELQRFDNPILVAMQLREKAAGVDAKLMDYKYPRKKAVAVTNGSDKKEKSWAELASEAEGG